MMGHTDFFFGHFETTIGDVLESLWDTLPPFQSAIIRAVDSTWDPYQLSHSLSRLGIPSAARAGAVVDVEGLKLANQRGLFTGFDEIWFFRSVPTADHLIAELKIGLTTDGGPVDEQTAKEISRTMRAVGCHLVLGDGIGLGLNCITTSREFWLGLEKQVAEARKGGEENMSR